MVGRPARHPGQHESLGDLVVYLRLKAWCRHAAPDGSHSRRRLADVDAANPLLDPDSHRNHPGRCSPREPKSPKVARGQHRQAEGLAHLLFDGLLNLRLRSVRERCSRLTSRIDFSCGLPVARQRDPRLARQAKSILEVKRDTAHGRCASGDSRKPSKSRCAGSTARRKASRTRSLMAPLNLRLRSVRERCSRLTSRIDFSCDGTASRYIWRATGSPAAASQNSSYALTRLSD